MLSPGVKSQCPGNFVVQDPPDFVWTYHPVTVNNPVAYYSGVMEVGEATFVMNNGATLTTRAYRQQGGSYSIPGPTIKVMPGKKYVISLHNTLPYAPLVADENVFKDPNASNLHTHGLHISGESPGDDVTRTFEGGRGGDFVWDIPANHMGGTFWYHAHHHGSSFLQVSGGMFGLLIVDDSNDGIPATVGGMTERELVFGYLDPAAAGTGGDVLLSGTLSPTWTVNGMVTANICMPPNTWQHWRTLIADRDARVKTIEFGPQCEVKLLARDGVWRSVAPGNLNTNSLELTGASRADFAIRATGNSWVRVGGATVANIYVEGTSDPSVHPYALNGTSTWSATRPNYLRDLRNETNVHLETVSMGARTINGGKWNHDVPTFSLPVNQVQEWNLSGAVNHPFHLHIYHVQALSSTGGFEAGEYYDVLAANMNFRFDLNAATSSPYDGRAVLHCHVLDHEDRGAMGWLDVLGGAGPPTFPADGDLAQPYSAYYTLGGPPAAQVIHVQNISVVRVPLSGSRFRADATVTIQNDLGAAVSGATVNGIFTGPTSSIVTGTTNVNGQVTFTSKLLKNPVGEWCFEVTNVSLAGATYNSVANVITKACESGPVFKTTPGGVATEYTGSVPLGVYPNPFSNSAQISFQIPRHSNVIIEVYSMTGERVSVITDRIYEAGKYLLEWDTPGQLGSGIYFMRLKAENIVYIQKLMLIR